MNKILFLAVLLLALPFSAKAKVFGDETVESPIVDIKDVPTILHNENLVQDAYFNAPQNRKNNTVKNFDYNPNEVPTIQLRENTTAVFKFDEPMHSPIIGAGDEFFKIKTWVNVEDFDDLSKGVVINDKFMIKAISGNKDTNLTFLASSGRIYTYMVRSLNFDSTELGDLVIYTKLDSKTRKEVLDAQAEAKALKRASLREAAKRINIEQDNHFMSYMKEIFGNKVNTNYQVYAKDENSKQIMPWAVFDNGVRTFFNYDGVTSSNEIPTISMVKNGKDNPMTKKDAYLLDPSYKGWVYVEGISQDGFTIKRGVGDQARVICVKPTNKLRQFHNQELEKVTTPVEWKQ